MSDLRSAVRERLDARTVALTAAVVALQVVVFGSNPGQALAGVAGLAAVGAGELLADATGLDDHARRGGLGVASLVGGAALWAGATDPGLAAASLPAAVALAGAWLVLDAVQGARHADPEEADDPPDGRAVYESYLAERVQAALADGPRSRAAVVAALDADRADVEATLSRLREAGVLVRSGGRYRRADADRGRLDRVGGWLRRAGRRLARPLLVEFRTGGPDDGDTGGRPARDREAREPDAERERG